MPSSWDDITDVETIDGTAPVGGGAAGPAGSVLPQPEVLVDGSLVTQELISIRWGPVTGTNDTSAIVYRELEGLAGYFGAATIILDVDGYLSYVDYALKPGTYRYYVVMNDSGYTSDPLELVYAGYSNIFYVNWDTPGTDWTAWNTGDAVGNKYLQSLVVSDPIASSTFTRALATETYTVQTWTPDTPQINTAGVVMKINKI